MMGWSAFRLRKFDEFQTAHRNLIGVLLSDNRTQILEYRTHSIAPLEVGVIQVFDSTQRIADDEQLNVTSSQGACYEVLLLTSMSISL